MLLLSSSVTMKSELSSSATVKSELEIVLRTVRYESCCLSIIMTMVGQSL